MSDLGQPKPEANYDIVIVGAGPAGSTASYLLKSYGFNVLLIDKDTFPRKKLCGGIITHKTLELMRGVFGETIASLEERGVLDYRADYYEAYYRSKLIVRKSVYPPLYFVDREVYDTFLLEKARGAGVDILEGAKVTAVNLSGSRAVSASGKLFGAKYIIGADGVNSIVGRQLSLDKKLDTSAWLRDLGVGVQVTVTRDEIEEVVDCPRLFFGFVKYGYCWVFPNRDKLLVGMGGLVRRNRPGFLDTFQEFLSCIGLSSGQVPRIVGHFIPYGNFLAEPVSDGAFLVGDSAGLVDPVIGEGLYYAQRSAELAAWALLRSVQDGCSPSVMYLDLLKHDIHRRLRKSKRMRSLLFPIFERLHYYYPMKLMLNTMNKSITRNIHGINEYTGANELRRA